MFGVDDALILGLVGAGAKLITNLNESDNRRDIAINESNNNAIVKGVGMTLATAVIGYGIKKFSESDSNNSKQKLLK